MENSVRDSTLVPLYLNPSFLSLLLPLNFNVFFRSSTQGNSSEMALVAETPEWLSCGFGACVRVRACVRGVIVREADLSGRWLCAFGEAAWVWGSQCDVGGMFTRAGEATDKCSD